MNNATASHIERFNTVVKEWENYCCLTRDGDLQRDACNTLQTLLRECGTLKSEAVTSGDEDSANLFLGFECVANCLLSELRMWLLLKTEQPDAAWDELVAAQMAADNAVRAHQGFA